MIINIILKDKRWIKIPLEEIAKGALKLIIDKFLGQNNNFEVSILASDDAEIRELNKNFRGNDSSTNIISWPEHETQSNQLGHIPDSVDKLKSGFEGLTFLGNLAISFDRCSSEAEEKNIHLEEGECFVVPKGVRHKPLAEEEAQVLLFEPINTAHTGTTKSNLTKSSKDQGWI